MLLGMQGKTLDCMKDYVFTLNAQVIYNGKLSYAFIIQPLP